MMHLNKTKNQSVLRDSTKMSTKSDKKFVLKTFLKTLKIQDLVLYTICDKSC